jgi:hypothetical protein
MFAAPLLKSKGAKFLFTGGDGRNDARGLKDAEPALSPLAFFAVLCYNEMYFYDRAR